VSGDDVVDESRFQIIGDAHDLGRHDARRYVGWIRKILAATSRMGGNDDQVGAVTTQLPCFARNSICQWLDGQALNIGGDGRNQCTGRHDADHTDFDSRRINHDG